MAWELFNIVCRAVLSLAILFFVTKLIGKKQVSELSLFDYVIGISIGNFAADMTIDLSSPVLYGVVAVIIFGIIAYFISILTMKSIALRRFFMGKPTVLIWNGKLLESGLKKVKFDINDFLEQCRQSGYFDISNIAYAVMEASGKISILPKSEYAPVINKDMGVKASRACLVANIIIDGKIMYKNLEAVGKDEKFINSQLKIKNKRLDDILLATIDNNEKVNFYDKIYDVTVDVLE